MTEGRHSRAPAWSAQARIASAWSASAWSAWLVLNACALAPKSVASPPLSKVPNVATVRLPELPASLSDGALGSHKKRILLSPKAQVRVERVASNPPSSTAALGSAALGSDALGSDAASAEPIECVVVEEGVNAERDARVVFETPAGARLLLYVPVADAVPTVRLPTPLRVKPSDDLEANPLGPVAFPGLALHVLEATDRWCHVAWNDGLLRAEGWVPQSVMVAVFEPVTPPDALPKAFELLPGTALRSSPKGFELAQTVSTEPLAVERLEPSKDGHVQVLLQVHHNTRLSERRIQYQVRGYVPENALGAPTAGVETGAAGLGITGGGERDSLAPETQFYDHPAGNVVGVAKRTVHAGAGLDAKDGWQSWVLETPWSPVTVWAPSKPKP